MLKRLSCALFASAALVAANSATGAAFCKPPDLPLGSKEICVPQLSPYTPEENNCPWQQACAASKISRSDAGCGSVAVYVGQDKSPAPQTADWLSGILQWFDANFGDAPEPAVPEWLSSLNTFLEQIGDSIGDLLNLNQTSDERSDRLDALNLQAENLQQMQKEWREFWQFGSSETAGAGGGWYMSGGEDIPPPGTPAQIAAMRAASGTPVDSVCSQPRVANNAEKTEIQNVGYVYIPIAQESLANPPAVAPKKPAPPPSIVEIINMKRNGVPEAIIVEQIRITGAVYSLTADDIIYLHQGGASSQLLTELQRRQPQAAVVTNVIYSTPQFMPPTPPFPLLRNTTTLERVVPSDWKGAGSNQQPNSELLPMPLPTQARRTAGWIIAQQRPEFHPMALATWYYLRTMQPALAPSTSANSAAIGMVSGLAAALASRTAACADQPLDAEAFKLHSVQCFYEIGKDCEDKGDIEMARNCYEEATRILPSSRFGEMASAKLQELKLGRTAGGVEATEEPPPAKDEDNRNDGLEARRLQESLRLLQKGERFERTGDLENAARCYRDALVICPAGRFGPEALQRMINIESLKARQRRS